MAADYVRQQQCGNKWVVMLLLMWAEALKMLLDDAAASSCSFLCALLVEAAVLSTQHGWHQCVRMTRAGCMWRLNSPTSGCHAAELTTPADLMHVAAELLIVTLQPLHKLLGRYHTRLLLGVLDLHRQHDDGQQARMMIRDSA